MKARRRRAQLATRPGAFLGTTLGWKTSTPLILISHWSPAAIDKAADTVIDRLHRALPDAVLVVIAPIWPTGSPPARCLDLRNHLRQKAASVGAIFIDPLAGKWFAGSSRRLIGPDGIHPTDAGHRHIAALVLAHLVGAA